MNATVRTHINQISDKLYQLILRMRLMSPESSCVTILLYPNGEHRIIQSNDLEGLPEVQQLTEALLSVILTQRHFKDDQTLIGDD
jgi:hypothetical protein